MGTPTSGTISLNEVHIEAGGSSGSQASFNDQDIRVMSGSNQNTQFSMSDMYDRAADFVQSGTVGTGSVTSTSGYFSATSYYRGYLDGTTSPANLSPTSESSYMGGGTITGVYCTSSTILGTGFKTFIIQSNASNTSNNDSSVFNSVVVNSTTYDRGDFTFSSSSSLTRCTIDDISPGVGFTNTTDTVAPFPANNTTYYVTFRRRV